MGIGIAPKETPPGPVPPVHEGQREAVYAYVAHRNGKWIGAIAGDMPDPSIRTFYVDCVRCTIEPVKDREQYNKALYDVTATDTADDFTAAETAEMEQLEEEKETIERTATARAFKPEQKAKGGCVIRIGEAGALIVEAGLVKPKEGNDARANPAASKKPQAEPTLDFNVRHELGRWRSTAAGEAVQGDERLALAAMLATVDNFHGPINIEFQMEGSHEKITAARTFPGALAILRKLSIDKLISLVVKAIAASIDVDDDDTGEFIDALDQKVYAEALRKQFDAKTYFKGASKAHILSVIEEALGVDEQRRNAEKSQTDLAKFAVDSVAPIGWLPAELRTASYVAPKPKPAAAPKSTASEAKAAPAPKAKPAKAAKKTKVAAATKKGAAKRKSR